MQARPRTNFPSGSLLAAMLGGHPPADVRRAAARLRAEGAPALMLDDDVAALARGLGCSEVAHSPAVPDALPPLFWLEARSDDGGGGISGWIVDRRPAGLAVRGFSLAPGPDAVPEPGAAMTVGFGARPGHEDREGACVRGLLTAASLPGMMEQMGEASPVILVPADAPERDAGALRGLRLSVAMSPESLPG